MQELAFRTDAARLPPTAGGAGGPASCRPLLQSLAAAFRSEDYQVSGGGVGEATGAVTAALCRGYRVSNGVSV